MCTYGWVLSYLTNNKGPAIRTYNSEVVVIPKLYGTDGAYLYCTVFPYTLDEGGLRLRTNPVRFLAVY